MSTSTPRIHRHVDADSFLQRAEPWLLRAEAEHNLVLGLARRLRQSTAGFEPPIYLATVEDAGEVVGCAFRTPPHKLGLTRMPSEALPLVVDDLAETYEVLPAVLGPESEVHGFARLWGRTKHTAARQGPRQRIYELDRVVRPDPMPAGRVRVAEPGDVELIVDWLEAFGKEAGVVTPNPRAGVQERVSTGSMFLWDDDGPRSMAAWAGHTPNGVRLGYVYTPPHWRGRGYATACVGLVSQGILDTGCRFCFLYTDLSNPTSNAIYQRIGYRPVCDVVEYVFSERGRIRRGAG